MSVVIRGGSSALNQEVRAGNNTDNAGIVSPEATLARAGYQGGIGIVDAGTVVANGIRREFDVSADFRQRVGIDTMLWQDVFSYTPINASAYGVITSTMTIDQSTNAGLLTLNASGVTATGNHVVLRTYRTFPVINAAPTYLYFAAIGVNQTAVNAQCDIGLGYALTTAAPTDGVFFRWKLDGDLVGVLCNNSVETETPALTKISDNERGEYLIVMNDEDVEFWIDGIFRARLTAVTTYTGHGVTRSPALPFVARLFNSGIAGAAKSLRLAEVSVSMGDIATNRPWDTQMAGMELGAHQIPPGATAAQSATWGNSAAPASIVLANNGAGANTLTTLGGLFQFAAPAGAETDFVIFTYTVPAGSVTQPGKNLVIRGVRIDTVNTGAAVATTATTLFWALGVGGTAADLATADSLTAATRAYRRIPLGIQSFIVGAVAGAQGPVIAVNFDAPVVVAPGTRVNGIVRIPIGTATGSQVIRGTFFVNGYFE
jgi:hypothetical protein